MPDYAPIEAFLVGRCGKSEREAALTTRREYDLLVEGKAEEARARMEELRWLAFRIYKQNPYILPPRAQTAQEFFRFPWEEPKAEEVQQKVAACTVTEDEAAILNKIFADLHKQREESANG